jgi:hypothetical protein
MPKPKQAELIPDIDRKLQDLEDAAEAYRDVRDERAQLTIKEVDAKATLLSLMKKHRKTEYRRAGIHIWIVVEEESVKVKIDPPAEDDEEGA